MNSTVRRYQSICQTYAHMYMSDRLDRLRPLRSAFHDAWNATNPSQDITQEPIFSEILAWLDDTNPSTCVPVFWLYSDARHATTAFAQSLAKRAREDGRLLASYFVSWTGDVERCDSANLIPTVMYQVAQFDKDLLRRVTHAIGTDRDIRVRDTKTQISVLVKKPFLDASVSLGHPILLIIDALDALDAFDHFESYVASNIGLFLRSLCATPLGIKVVITSRLSQTLQHILEYPQRLQHRVSQLQSSIIVPRVQRDRGQVISDTDRGMLF
jgi:hypothetical protein